MARICKKEGCNNHVPKSHVDENGKKHNCQRRKFCFECSPYGQHNTRNFNYKPPPSKRKAAHYYFHKRKKLIIEKVQSIVGNKCWKCNYDTTWRNLCFHHVDPDKKLFNLSTRDLMGHKWDKVFNEMKKCALLCMNCHGETHAGIIESTEIEELWKEKW